jgi:hypothetical protein
MTILLVALLAAAVLLVLVAVLVRRRARAREARRLEALAHLAERLEASLEDLRPPSFQPVEATVPPSGGDALPAAQRLPGRAALLDAVATEVARATAAGSRLTVARVRASAATSPEQLADAVRAVAAGDAVLSPAITRQLLDQVGRRLPAPVSKGGPTRPRSSSSPACSERRARASDARLGPPGPSLGRRSYASSSGTPASGSSGSSGRSAS